MIMVPGTRRRARPFVSWSRARRDHRGEHARAAALHAHDARDRFERDYILRALAAQQGNISRTAEALGIERSNLYRKMRAFGIMPARKAEDEEAV
jgi:two-component system nitrogen regulation response regulator NtrX